MGQPVAGGLLSRVGVDEPDEARAKALVFRSFLLALIAVESWEHAMRLGGDPLAVLLAVVASVAAALVFRPRLGVAATAVMAVVVGIDFVSQWPGNPNHQYFQLVLLALLLLLRTDVDEEVTRLTELLRWLLVIGLFWAGMQKLLYGYYFDGEFLAYTITQNERFALALEPLMPAAEFERIRAIAVREGAGPFRVGSLAFVLASNVAYLAELVLPALLLVRPMRKLAVAGILLYFVAIESAAREVFFGGMMAALVLSYGPPAWLQRALPFALAGLSVLLATSFGLLPGWFFS